MDTTTAVVIIVVVLVILFFGYTFLTDSKATTTGNTIGSSPSYPSQQYGGGCGR